MNKNLIIGIILVLVIAGGGWFLFKDQLMSPKPAAEITNVTSPVSDDSVKEVPAPGNTAESTDSSTTGVKEFTVTASNFKFDTPEIKVKKGDTVKITFKNAEGFHNFVIDEFGVKTKQGNGPSEETVTFVADKAGNYEFYCSVGQHRAMGLKGKFIVE